MIIRATQAPKDAYEQVKKYADKVDLIVCSGGDGTLDEVVTGITEAGKQGSGRIHTGRKHQRLCQQPFYAEKYAGCGIYDHEGRDLQMRRRADLTARLLPM